MASSGQQGRPLRPLRVLVDGIHLIREAKGVGLYTRNVLRELLRLGPELEIWVIVLAGSPALESSDLRPVEVRWRNHLWHGFRTLPRILADIRPDVVWMPYEAPAARLARPCLMVCHDIPSEIRRAQRAAGESPRLGLGRLRDWLDDRLLARTLRAADLVFSNSGYVADRLVSDFGVERRKIRLAPCAPGADFAALSREVDVQGVRERLGLGEGYVLTFFTGDARENPGIVPEVYRRLVEAGIRPGLVVAGLKPEDREAAESRFSAFSSAARVRYLPFYGAEEIFKLTEIYTAASAYFDPSLHEGFGMQVVEAMACGTPVVCSDRGALPEVTAGAALLADPTDPEALTARLLAVLNDADRRAELVELGTRRARGFSWRRTAGVVYQGVREAAGG